MPAYLEGDAAKARDVILAMRRHWRRIILLLCFSCWLLQYMHVCRGPSLVYRRTRRNQELLSSCERIKGTYIPTPFLFTGWLHTLWMFLAYVPPDVDLQRQILPTVDGGHLTVDWACPAKGQQFHADSPVIIIVPGVAGSGRKTTWRGVMHSCSAAGLPSVCLSWRGYDGTELTYPFASHLGFIDDIDVLVDEIQKRWGDRAIGAIGISMGGHALARYVGVKGGTCRLRAAVCISAGYSIVDGFRVLATQPISDSILNSRFQVMSPAALFCHVPCFCCGPAGSGRASPVAAFRVLIPLHGLLVHEHGLQADLAFLYPPVYAGCCEASPGYV